MSARSPRTASLGRGLAALIPQAVASTPGPAEIAISQVERNPHQPRTQFGDEALGELAASITAHGVLQPILVTETLDGYRLVAGERRLRAALMAGLERIPAIIRQADDQDQLELALVENLQRTDLNAMDAARAYRQLRDQFGLTNEAIADRLGKARPTIANTLRLLDLEPEVQDAIGAGAIGEGHGRAMLGLAPLAQREILALAISRRLSVRQVEELARRLREDAGPARTASLARKLDAETERVEDDLRRALGTKVRLARTRRGGRIIIEWYSNEELGRLYERLTRGNG
ncbi:MAG TPA: ParB/RepB/Spo0J family partition protein [Patescibacteria group bacterium]|nr:ParB/RepB/Spo0J family partition protein [Patescibacteria group bacterium]